MCGIAGVFSSKSGAELRVKAMTAAISHRGPDGFGHWTDSSGRVAFGHRRLAIVDLSENGAQPMTSHSGRYTICFNGEVYNHSRLKSELKGYRWRGHSDTEVMLAAFEHWGVDAVDRFNGMFAFALWDNLENELHLVRDPMGIKPLYYGWHGDAFLFGSELKSLCADKQFRRVISPAALSNYLCYGYVPAPLSIYQDTYKLPVGSRLTLRSANERSTPTQYWSTPITAARAQPFSSVMCEDECIDLLDAALNESISTRLEADVPVGSLLSGGIDSSLVSAIAQRRCGGNLKTFSIGFQEAAYNEAAHAEVIAKQLGTDHTTLYVSPAEALEVIPHLPQIYDEPFADSSQIPTCLVFALASKHVTVGLSGDGGDELFGGYTRYPIALNRWSRVASVPFFARRLVGQFLLRIPFRVTRNVRGAGRFFGYTRSAESLHYKMRRFAAMAAATDISRFSQVMNSMNNWTTIWGDHATPEAFEPGVLSWQFTEAKDLDALHRMMLADTMYYLPDDILTKVDRASMAVGFEARVPLLDTNVVALAWKFPTAMKLRSSDKGGKFALRKLLSRYLEPSLFDRPKQGFGVPINLWLRRELRDWAESLLNTQRLNCQGIFDARAVQAIWQEYQSGNDLWAPYLWCVLMFQSWHDRWMVAAPDGALNWFQSSELERG